MRWLCCFCVMCWVGRVVGAAAHVVVCAVNKNWALDKCVCFLCCRFVLRSSQMRVGLPATSVCWQRWLQPYTGREVVMHVETWVLQW